MRTSSTFHSTSGSPPIRKPSAVIASGSMDPVPFALGLRMSSTTGTATEASSQVMRRKRRAIEQVWPSLVIHILVASRYRLSIILASASSANLEVEPRVD